LIKQGGVRENGVPIDDYYKIIDPRGGDKIIQVGKRKFIKLIKKH